MKKIGDRIFHFADELEKIFAETLYSLNILFIHSSEAKNQRLDFYLPDYDVFVEIKKFHSERSVYQLSSKDNVILIQGRRSLEAFCKILTGDPFNNQRSKQQ